MILTGTAALLAASTAAAQTPASAPAPGRPTVVIQIVVDQFGSDLFSQYRGRLGGGLRRLSDEGVVYPNGYQAHAATETCPGHSTVATGAHPSVSGIVANDWIDRATGEEVYCLHEPRNTLADGGKGDNGPVGPTQLLATTLSDWIRGASPEARVYAVSGKDRGAINLAGHRPDGAYWFTEGFGFTTYLEPGQRAVERLRPVAGLNARIKARLAAAAPGWTYSTDACRKLAGEWQVGGQTFRADLPPQRFKLDTSPSLDELTLEAATTLLNEQRLGQRGVTDFLGIALSATDRIGHAFGQQGPEMCEQMHRLDAALGAFLDRVATTPGAVVVLTADHGGSDFPERLRARGYAEAGRGDPAILREVNAALKARFGLTVDPLASGASGLMVVGEGGRGLAQPLRDQIATVAVELLRQQPQIAGAWTQAEVLASPPPPSGKNPQLLTLLERERLNAYPDRSPDIILAFEPGITPGQGRVGGTVSGHGTPWDYDRRVPIVFWRPGQTGEERVLPIETVDIAPTLANLLGVTPPDTVAGRCLPLPGGPACPATPNPKP